MGKSGAERQRDLQARRKLALADLTAIRKQAAAILARIIPQDKVVRAALRTGRVDKAAADYEELWGHIDALRWLVIDGATTVSNNDDEPVTNDAQAPVSNDAPVTEAFAVQTPVTNKPRKVKGGIEIDGKVYTLNVDSLLRDGQRTDAYVRRQGGPATGGTVWAVGLWRRGDIAVTTHPTRTDGITAAVALLAAQS